MPKTQLYDILLSSLTEWMPISTTRIEYAIALTSTEEVLAQFFEDKADFEMLQHITHQELGPDTLVDIPDFANYIKTKT